MRGIIQTGWGNLAVPNSDEYRAKALECLEQACRAPNPAVRDEFTNLAVSYVKLCVLAEQNATTDLVYETPPRPRIVE